MMLAKKNIVTFAALAISAIISAPAQATCWALTDQDVASLQKAVDRNPLKALGGINHRLTLAAATSTTNEQAGRLLAVQAAAYANSLNGPAALRATRAGLRLPGISNELKVQLISSALPAMRFKAPRDIAPMLKQLRVAALRLKKISPASICAADAVGVLLGFSGNHAKALQNLVSAYHRAKAARLEGQSAVIAQNLALALRNSGDLDAAREFNGYFSRWAASHDLPYHGIRAILVSATIALASNNHRLAAEKMATAASLARSLDMHRWAAIIKARECEALLAGKLTQHALAACREAEAGNDPNAPNSVMLNARLGAAKMISGDHAAALRAFDAALASPFTPSNGATLNIILQNRARTHAALGNFKSAYADSVELAKRTAFLAKAQRDAELAKVRGRFLWEQQRASNAELTRDLAISAAERQRRQMWLILTSLSTLLLLAALAWVILAARQRRRHLEANALAAQELAKDKANLLATMSHEIRSPIGSLTLAAHRLASSADMSRQARGHAELLVRTGDRLTKLLDDLLLLSRIDSSALPVSPTRFNIYELLSDTLNTYQARLESAEIQIATRISPNTPRFIYSDPIRIGQVMNNLIENAIVHSRCNSISVNISSQNSGFISFSVKDNGRGIAHDQQGMLFKRFSQLPTSSSSGYGTGLGLAICKGLVDLLGGDIELNSKPGLGVHVRFHIPLSAEGAEVTSTRAFSH